MPFNNVIEPIGIVNNPILKTPFVAAEESSGFPIPPSNSYIIAENGDFLITEDNNRMITE